MANHFDIKYAECIEKYDVVKFYEKLWTASSLTEPGQKSAPRKTGVCLAASYYWIYECIRLEKVKKDWNITTGINNCELQEIYNLQKDYEESLTNGATFGDEVRLIEGLWGLTYPSLRLNVSSLENLVAMESIKAGNYFTDDNMQDNSGILMAINSSKKNKDGHAVAFYKKNGEIFFFDVETGCYKIYNMYGFLAGNSNFVYDIACLSKS